MEISVEPSKTYAVTTSGSCTVTDADGLELCTASSGSQAFFVATTPTVTISDDGAKVSRATFNYALAVAGLLGGGDKLPAGYTRLEFLESTGYSSSENPSIPHFRVPLPTIENSDNWEFVTAHAVDFSTGAAQVEGLNATGSVQPVFYGVTAGKKLYAGSGGGLVTNTEVKVNEQKHSFAFRQKGKLSYVAYDGEEIKLNANTTTPPTELGIFAALKRGTAGYFYPFNGKKYSWKFIKNGKVIRNLIPALDDTGTPCMYDLVTREPYRNAGSGQFVVGMTLSQVRALRLPAGGGKLTLSLPHEASIDRLAQAALERARANGWTLTLQYAEADVPAGYRRLEFLESTGTQYIDTGIKADAGISAACVYYQSPEVLESATGPQYIFGCGADTGIFAFLGLHTAAPSTLFYYKSTLTLRAERPAGKIACLCDATGMELNGTRYEFSSTAELTESFDNCKLFARADGKFATWANAKAQVYSFSISRAGELQLDYVPCISPEGTLGMYNKVDGSFQENKGTGSFIAGLATVDDVRKLWLPETGGEITVSVPSDTPDSAVEQLRKNNPTWQIAIQFRTDNEN